MQSERIGADEHAGRVDVDGELARLEHRRDYGHGAGLSGVAP
ncbi:hypothetical protein [Natronococcus amylolyticus]|nr:hypothetical protein [Natronococcus amylolyticus]